MPADITFLLGAGAVMDAGLPGSVGLADNIHKHLSDNAGDAQMRLQLELLRFLDGGIRFQRGLLGMDPRSPINIEQLATAALRLANRADNPLAPFVSGWNGRLTDLESTSPSLLRDFVDTLFGRLSDELATPADERIAYLANIDRFRDFGHVSVYSLNYDMSFEAALQSINRTCINGFENGVWSPIRLQTVQEVRYLKLHGSLDWVDDSEFGICSLEYPAHPESSEMIGQPPLLIFGTDSKMTAREPFLSQLHHFSLSLDNCDVLVMIGYSFGDSYINELIQQRFTSNTVMHVFTVAPTPIGEMFSDSVPALHPSPRVTHLELTARDALQDNHLFREVGDRLTSAQEESPFGVDD